MYKIATVPHVLCANLTWLILLLFFFCQCVFCSFLSKLGGGWCVLDVCGAELEELTFNLASHAFPTSGFQAITKKGWDYQECLRPLCAQPLFIFWGFVNLGPGVNAMLSKRKPSLVNFPLNLMRILHPANTLTGCMTLVQRPQKFSIVLSAVKTCTLRNIAGLAFIYPGNKA